MKKQLSIIGFILLLAPLWAQNAVPAAVVSKFSVRGYAVSPDDAESITDLFMAELAQTGKLRVVDRSSIDKVVREMQFQSSDWSDPEKTTQLGAALNAKYLVTGQIARVGDYKTMVITALDIKKLVVVSTSVNWYTPTDMFDSTSKENNLFSSMPNMAKTIAEIKDVGQGFPLIGMTTFSARGDAVSPNDAETITEIFMAELVNTNLMRIIDRNRIDTVANEMNFQTSDWSDPQKTAQLGAVLNTGYLVTGQINKLGNTISVVFNMVDIKTLELVGSTTERFTTESIFKRWGGLWTEMPRMATKIAKDTNSKLPPPNLFVGRWQAIVEVSYSEWGRLVTSYGGLNYILNIQTDGTIIVEHYDTITLNYNVNTHLFADNTYYEGFSDKRNGNGTGKYGVVTRIDGDTVKIPITLSLRGITSDMPTNPTVTVLMNPSNPTMMYGKFPIVLALRRRNGTVTGRVPDNDRTITFTRLE